MLRGQREEERGKSMGCASSKSTLISTTSGGVIVFEEKRGRTSGTKCEWNSFVRFQFDTTNFEDDDEGETVALETTSVPAQLTQKWVRS